MQARPERRVVDENIRTPRGNRIMRFYVSTEKVDHQILLRIDEVTERATA